MISVTCSSLQALERLWDDYCSGHLSQVVQKLLVTPEGAWIKSFATENHDYQGEVHKIQRNFSACRSGNFN